MNGTARSFRNLSAVCAVVAGLATAQSVSTSQINGSVQDSSGLPVPNAEIKLTQLATGALRTTVTAADGAYVFPSLAVGPYQLEVTKEGFTKYVQSGIVLQVDTNPEINIVLKVGSVAEQVVVEAAASMVETHSTGVGQLVDSQRIVDLPLNGRQATDLIFLAGAATIGPAGDLSSNKNYPTQVISVAGGQSNGMTYLLDGGTHNDPFNNLNLPIPFPDVLQEFKVETSALPAQYGHHAAAAVNAVTKSGTNEFHGDLFEFVRNGVFNARNFFAAARDSLKRNQFGGTFGGPVLKNKLFFFAGYQGTITRSDPPTRISFVPTAAMLQGDFTTIASPTCNAGRQITLKAPFSNNKIAPGLFSKPALNILKYIPSTDDPCGQVTFGIPAKTDEHQGIGRVDYQWSAKHSLFGRYFLTNLEQPPIYDGKNALTTGQAGSDDRVQSLVLGDTYLLGSATISSFRATVNRSRILRTSAQFFSGPEVGVDMSAPVPKFMVVTITGGFGVGGGTASPGFFNTTALQAAEDLSLVRGSHQIGFGANYIHTNANAATNLFTNASFAFTTQGTNLGLADFLTGNVATYVQGEAQQTFERQHYIGLYVQDSWRVSSRFTLNAGLRWEPMIPAITPFGWLSHYDLSAFLAGVKSTRFVNAPAGVLFPGDVNGPTKAGFNSRLAEFAPRLGVVWDPKGNGRQTIRASWGVFYDLPHLYSQSHFGAEPPWGSQINLIGPLPFATPWQGYPGGNFFPVSLSKDVPFPTGGTWVNYPLDTRPTYVEQWNLSLQKQIGASLLLSASYVGNVTVHLWTAREMNPATYFPGGPCVLNGVTYNPCSTTANSQQRRLLSLLNPSQGQYYGSITQLDDGGTQSYNALLLSLQRRLSRNVTVNGNYTWSHCIADLVNSELAGNSPSYIHPDNRRGDRGNCSSDKRQLLNISAVYQTPRFSERWVERLAGEWKLASIVRAQSGSFLSVQTGLDNSLTALVSPNGGASAQRPNQVLTNVYGDRSYNFYLNPAAFAQPATGTFGNIGIANIEGPGSLQVDASLSRVFRIRERKTLEFRADAFNLPNHTRLGNPSTSLSSNTFGKINTAADPRIMQFALKYVF